MVEEKNKDNPVYEKRVYTVEEIMDILDISKNAAYSLVNSGVFHYVKVGGHYRISKKSFDNWLEADITKE
ncbi:MAG: helix-turn-helix domain-containing protein [Acutalibacteraceae bacterium]|nr:helix-turn-helix domain-containing protein [Acutalibacteraceae bacterium]